MSTTPSVRVGANVRAEMARRGLTQTQLAAQIGISQAQLSKRLAGQIAFDVDELAAIGEALGGVSIAYFTTEAGVSTR